MIQHDSLRASSNLPTVGFQNLPRRDAPPEHPDGLGVGVPVDVDAGHPRRGVLRGHRGGRGCMERDVMGRHVRGRRARPRKRLRQGGGRRHADRPSGRAAYDNLLAGDGNLRPHGTRNRAVRPRPHQVDRQGGLRQRRCAQGRRGEARRRASEARLASSDVKPRVMRGFLQNTSLCVPVLVK